VECSFGSGKKEEGRRKTRRFKAWAGRGPGSDRFRGLFLSEAWRGWDGGVDGGSFSRIFADADRAFMGTDAVTARVLSLLESSCSRRCAQDCGIL